MTARPKKGHIAFWAYDQFPYLLGGEIVASKGGQGHWWVETRDFGAGYYFRVRFTMPPTRGRTLLAKLKELRGDYRMETEQLRDRYEQFQRRALVAYGVGRFAKKRGKD